MAENVKLTTLEQLKIALQAAKAYVDGEIGGLGTLAGKNEVAYDDLAAALKSLIDGKADGAAFATLVGEDTGKSVRAISAEEVAKIVADADADFDTLKEIADWIMSDTTGAAKMASDISRLDAILEGIGDTTAGEKATVVAYVESVIEALNIGQYATTEFVNGELAKKVEKVEGSRLMTNVEGTKLAGIAEGAQVNVIEEVQVNGVKVDPTDKKVNIVVPTGAMASKDQVSEGDLEETLKAKVNAAAEGNHSHDNKALLDTYTQTEANLADAVAKKHEHANKEVLDGISSTKVAAWDAAEGNAKAYADGLAKNYDASGAAAQALADAKAYANGLAGNYDAAGSAAQALVDAKAYVDGMVATDAQVTAICTEVFGG